MVRLRSLESLERSGWQSAGYGAWLRFDHNRKCHVQLVEGEWRWSVRGFPYPLTWTRYGLGRAGSLLEAIEAAEAVEVPSDG